MQALFIYKPRETLKKTKFKKCNLYTTFIFLFNVFYSFINKNYTFARRIKYKYGNISKTRWETQL